MNQGSSSPDRFRNSPPRHKADENQEDLLAWGEASAPVRKQADEHESVAADEQEWIEDEPGPPEHVSRRKASAEIAFVKRPEDVSVLVDESPRLKEKREKAVHPTDSVACPPDLTRSRVA